MAVSSYILALDQGTTSSRALLVDSGGAVRGVAAQEFPQHFPRPGWVEHDPEEIWESQRAAMEQVLAETGVSPSEIAAIGVTNQRETTLAWRRSDGRPIYPAIVWQDRRTADRCAALRAGGDADLIRERTGLVTDPYFSGTKLAWLLEHVPGARAAAEAGDLAFGTVDTWLLAKLTGRAVHRTDRTNASRTLLWNLREERWDPELLVLFGIPPAVLPEVAPSVAEFGVSELGPPICGVAGDQQAALFGQAGWGAGIAKNTYGTGCFLLLHTGDAAPPPPPGLLATAACDPSGGLAYAVEGSVFIGGAAVQWLRDGLGLIGSAAETEALACSVPDTGGVYVVPAFAGLGAPYWDASARGTIVGLTRGTTRAHLVRATLEAVALQCLDVVEAMSAAGVRPQALRVDGGASENQFLMQFQADVLGIPVERAAVRETTALGAAYLAGLGAGVWSPGDLDRLWRADRVFEPRMSADARESIRTGW
ncbi:MAG: glycerol kinase GlpK, partial [SAR202 cluster bacterium]|nr:glycerol kinase GlpK [SAR202 cluster bacterium]